MSDRGERSIHVPYDHSDQGVDWLQYFAASRRPWQKRGMVAVVESKSRAGRLGAPKSKFPILTRLAFDNLRHKPRHNAEAARDSSRLRINGIAYCSISRR